MMFVSRAGLPSFRSPGVFWALSRALARANRTAFRLTAFSVQTNHVHLRRVESPLVVGLQDLELDQPLNLVERARNEAG